jgi:hypothetical protein
VSIFIKAKVRREHEIQHLHYDFVETGKNPVLLWSERRYAALKELQEGGGVYLGWSNHVLGAGPFTWSEHMKVSPY